ncbi:acid-sensing ion channel 3-like, partial [Rhincodon typus]|uniref:acid-sensing ion channel 3-like n=1 Tax=Rhincodon typus TaxID=259920 RepID=UPI00202EABD1|eukprot:g30074.t1
MGLVEEEERKSSDITVFAESCTLHGINHIFLPGGVTIRRLLWALCFLMSLALFLYQVVDRVDYYIQYHHVTTLDEMDSSSMVFPAVTLCNQNRLRKSQVTENDVYWLSGLLGVKEADLPAFLATIGRDSDITSFTPSNSYDMMALFDRAGHDLTEMLLDCRYRSEECQANNFVQ